MLVLSVVLAAPSLLGSALRAQFPNSPIAQDGVLFEICLHARYAQAGGLWRTQLFSCC